MIKKKYVQGYIFLFDRVFCVIITKMFFKRIKIASLINLLVLMNTMLYVFILTEYDLHHNLFVAQLNVFVKVAYDDNDHQSKLVCSF